MHAGCGAGFRLQVEQERGVVAEGFGATPAFYVALFLRGVYSVLVLENVSTTSGSTTMVHFKPYFS